MHIRYKVVTRKRRSCQVADTKWELHYPKGAIVTAKRYTPGIMVFADKDLAQKFCSSYGYMILRVRPIGKALPQPRRLMSVHFMRTILNWRDYLQVIKQLAKTFIPGVSLSVPVGTICYSAVEVLD